MNVLRRQSTPISPRDQPAGDGQTAMMDFKMRGKVKPHEGVADDARGRILSRLPLSLELRLWTRVSN